MSNSRISIMSVMRVCVCLVLIVLVLHAGSEGAEARRRNRKNRGGKRRNREARKNNRHRRGHADVLDGENLDARERLYKQLMRPEAEHDDMVYQLMLERSRPITPPISPVNRKQDITQWRVAHISVEATTEGQLTENAGITGKFGFHSKLEDVIGKVVHISDSGHNSHYGCSGIANKKQIPKDKPWIALIQRGKCYFFNKIKLGERHNASAVVVYDNSEGEIQVMNTAGTQSVSLMIDRESGERMAKMADSGDDVIMRIKVGEIQKKNSQNGTSNTTTTIASAVKEPLVQTTTGGCCSISVSTSQTSMFLLFSILTFYLFNER